MITGHERKQQRRERILSLYLRYRQSPGDVVDTAAATAIQMVFGYPAAEVREAVASMSRPPHRPGEYPVGCMAYDSGRLA